MLNVMRDNLRHLKWVLVVVALAMLGYLGSYFDPRVQRGGPGSDWAARVDGKAISTQELLQVARSQDEYYRSLLGAQYEQTKKSLKLGSQALQSLVDRQLVLLEARGLGLAASKDQISKAILENPSFKDQSGSFVGKDRYTDYIGQNYDGGVEAYERRLGEDILAQQWLALMTASARVSEAEIEQAWRSRNVRAAADYVFVPSSTLSFDQSVDAATLSAWHTSHSADYKRAEARKVRLLVIDRQSQVPSAKVSDSEVKADYETHAANYTRAEQRSARHILFKLPSGAADPARESVRDLAASVLARAQKGEDFAALARSMSQDSGSAAQGGDLGWFGRGAMVKPFDDAVFGTPPGQFAPLVETEYGFHVILVQDSRAAGTSSFDEVKDGIRRRLELQRAHDLAAAEAQRLAAGIKTPADLDAAAAKAGINVVERLVSGEDRAADLGPTPEFSRAVEAMQPGQVSAPLGLARGFAIAACVEVLPSAVLPLSEISDRVKSDVLNQRGRQAAIIAARRIVAGASLDDGAKALKLEVKKTGDLEPGSDIPGIGPASELDAALFRTGNAVGSKGVAASPGGAIAYEITRHDSFDLSRFEADKAALRSQLLRQRRDQLAQGLIEGLRERHTVEINQPLIDGING